MLEIIIDTLLDGIKLLPFLFVAFLIIEFFEHKVNNKKIISKNNKYGPIVGALLGLFPQCGFSVMATNLYATRIVTLGTLISIYLATSDEMLPILLSRNVDFSLIIKILGIKFLVGMISGVIIDLLIKNKNEESVNYQICEDEHCECSHGIFLSTLKHTFNTLLFVLVTTFVINILFNYVDSRFLEKIFLKNTIFGSFVMSILGLVPSCGASIMITELYLNNMITFGSMIAGLLTGSGAAILVLFKVNKNVKDNLKILSTIYFVGSLIGLIIDLLSKALL